MKITLKHNGQVLDGNESDSLFAQLKAAGYPIKSTCGGCASCGQCIVIIDQGEANLQEPTFEEKQLIGNVFHITKERLSCQTYIHGDVTVDISAHLETASKKLTTVRRTKEQAEQVVLDRQQKRQERKENKPKKIGGGKKPKAFNFKDEENSQD